MSIYDQTLHSIKLRIRAQYQSELRAENQYQKIGYRCLRWITMVGHEAARVEIGVRAESLSYFTLFSLLPLLAGAFLLLSFFAQWSPVQNGFEGLITRFLQPIPDSYRGDLIAYVLQFKNDYLLKLSDRSSSLGIFALVILVWIVAKVFFNIENLMNRIWSTDTQRYWFERIQNFVFCSVVAPIVATVAITLPGLLHNFGGVNIGIIWDQGLPSIILFLGLLFVYRYFPNTKVRWKSALIGAVSGTALFMIANLGLKIYFMFGTETAYGKMAVLPLFAFFIYVFWGIFIVGAQVSFLVQNPDSFTGHELPSGTFAESVLMVEVVRHLIARFHLGKPVLNYNDLTKHFKVGSDSMTPVLSFLVRQKVVLEVSNGQKDVVFYSLARELNEDSLLSLIKDYLHVGQLSQSFDVQSVIAALNSK